MQLFAILPYAFIRYRAGGSVGFDKSLLTDKTAIFLSILAVIPAHLLTLGVAWAVVTRLGQRPFWPALGWSWSRNFGFWASAGLALLLLVIGVAITKLIGGEETQLDQLIASSTAARYTTAFLATVSAPLVEEVVYRGILYSALQKALGAGWAIVGVLALFTLVHVPQYWPNYGVIAVIGLLSFALTLVRAYTGRLLPCFVIHLVFNGVQAMFLIFGPYLHLPGAGGEQKAAAMGMLASFIHTIF